MVGNQRPVRRRARRCGAAGGGSWGYVLVATAHQPQAGHGLVGAGPVGLFDHEAHVDDHPVARGESLLGQHADVDLAVLTRDVDEGQLVAVALQHPDDLTRYPQTHDVQPSRAGVACRVPNRVSASSIATTAPGTAAATGSDRPMPSSMFATSQPTTMV